MGVGVGLFQVQQPGSGSEGDFNPTENQVSDGGKKLISSQYQPSTRMFNIKLLKFSKLNGGIKFKLWFYHLYGIGSDLKYKEADGDGTHKLDSHL